MSKVKAKGQMAGMKISRSTFKKLNASGADDAHGAMLPLRSAKGLTMKSGPGISCGAGSPHAANANLPATKKTKGV